MDETQSMGEVQEAGTSPRQLFPPSNIAHCLRGGTGLFPAAAYSATPVLRTAAATEVAKDPSDGGDGVELSSPNASGISSCNTVYTYTVYTYIIQLCTLLDNIETLRPVYTYVYSWILYKTLRPVYTYVHNKII